MSMSKQKFGRLVRAMYGTRDAPQIWVQEAKKEMEKLQFEASDAQTFVVAHMDDFVCVGPWEELELLYASLEKVYDSKNTMFREGVQQVNYLNRVIRRKEGNQLGVRP